ncbi:MAG TPA: universal stress protein [Propionibacteriaceae bacterium]|nr:universal stress protein [Propionibacteriaceae bacterium]
MSTGRIVVGVDGSPHSIAALRWALDHAERLGWQVQAVYAWQLPMIAVPGAFDPDEMERVAGEELVRTVSQVAPSPRVPLETTTVHGDAGQCLIAAAQGADLLVLGTRGRSPFRGLLLGAVSQGCAASSPCPVVIVKNHNI